LHGLLIGLVLIVLYYVLYLGDHLLECSVIDLAVLNDCLAEVVSDLLEHVRVEMQVGVLAEVAPTKAGLEGE